MIEVDEDGPGLDLDALAEAILAHDADVTAWDTYQVMVTGVDAALRKASFRNARVRTLNPTHRP